MNVKVSPSPVAVVGEVLFDRFPDDTKILGGAPFNVAWNLAALGLDPVFISGLGDDHEATVVKKAMSEWGLSATGLQTHPGLPTGQVDVTFDDGEPQYDIAKNQAYDVLRLDWLEDNYVHPLKTFGIMYHGSLAFRSQVNQGFFEQLIAAANGVRFVDLNIRKPWFDAKLLPHIIGGASWLKLSQQELEELSGMKIQRASMEEIHAAVELFESMISYEPPQNYLVTLGSQGAFWISQDFQLYQPAAETEQIVDSVGAGDAFSAAAIDGLVRLLPPKLILEHAVDFAARACSIQGAITKDRLHYRNAGASDFGDESTNAFFLTATR